MKYEIVNLSNLARDVIDELQEQHPDRNVEITIAPEISVNGDPALLRAVVANLLDNAWKYTAKKQYARIEFTATINQDNNEAIYCVRDNGAGFDMAFADKLFRAFQRLHKEEEFPGVGVGLATVQRIINRHGGKIWAESEVDKGAAFYFTLNS